ncbi:MAG TPA: SH3 domain-containing protein [Saprospiraceae bacterium]|nr:SH3 domain-containing protein [Saprospiraceae bacterium]HPI05518.1 SH3 domain-containing protein [Saprospiraceae bacterium]
MKLPRIESLIILVFFGCVVLWGISKCSSRRSDLVRRVREATDEETDERPVRRDTIRIPANNAESVPTPASNPAPVQQTATTPALPTPAATTPAASTVPGTRPARPTLSNKSPSNTPAPATTSTTTATTKYSSLFVTIDGLKLRKQPGLKGEVVATLELYEEVYFLNKKSEKTEEISLGLEKVTDHWVKIRTKAGKEGWVFGAGVHYYKMKRKGVM